MTNNRNLSLELRDYVEENIPWVEPNMGSWAIALGITLAMRHPEWAQWFYETELKTVYAKDIASVDIIPSLIHA